MCNKNGKVPSQAEAMDVLLNPIRPCGIISFLQIKEHRNQVLIMDESFPAKRFKSNKMINSATSGSEPILHVSKQVMGLEIPDKSTIDHSFHGFTDATCHSNRAIIGGISWILTRLWIGITIAFLQSEGKSWDKQIL